MAHAFTASKIEQAARFHDENGFVVFSDILSHEEFATLRAAVDVALTEGRLRVGEGDFVSNNDIVFADARFEALCRHPKIVTIARKLIGHPIELQHAKFNAKPLKDQGAGTVRWHQDYPFYPHTNYDMVSSIVHLDDEDEHAGPVRFIQGSHKWGPLSHVAPDGKFAYECTGRLDLDDLPSTLITGPAGQVSFHHCLTLHTSAPKRRPGHRRFVVFQYRAVDAVQMAGVVWRCNGMAVEERSPEPRMARFPDGATVELRGLGGRLFDMAGRLAPDRPAP